MSTIPTSVTKEQFESEILPALRVAKRGYVCRIELYKVFNYILYRLHTGCQWAELPIEKVNGVEELSYHAVYYHYRKWSRDGSLAAVFARSVERIRAQVDTHYVNLDGSHALAKKGGEEVAYQGRKKGKTSNILPITDARGFVLATTTIVAGNHNDAYHLPQTLRTAFKFIKARGIPLVGSYFNADSAFDTKAARQVCFQHKLIPNIALNPRGRKQPKRGRKRLFNAAVYKLRFAAERSFAWVDKFRALLIRFDRRAAHFLGSHFIAFTMINLRHCFAPSKSQ
jgi:transposase